MLKDKEIREPLFEFLDETFGKVRIIEEKTIGRSRADVLMVMENALVGIEIKSDADTYERLARQVRDYNSFFDYNIVAVGTSHAAHIAEHVPDWWGIITIEEIDGKADFYYYRKIQPNPKAIDQKRQLGFLWRPELAHIQEQNGLAKYQRQSKRFVIGKILEEVEEATLKRQICEELFERDYNEIAEKIADFKKSKRNTGKKF
ncbi:sce7726 family protein [Hominifimenecus sp. rT4P-3]|uniref:sce7726 family protein n=1 Tax=Hominifimenecus sp. rT4P-3 TaxID=3242979 RepID=UPI003DA31E0A